MVIHGQNDIAGLQSHLVSQCIGLHGAYQAT
jgi:hypothetical protein